MGKGVASRHQRFTKEEKTKVKLKAKKDAKKDLPKGTNVTKTNFKVKKIVLREQLKASDESQPLSKTKLGVKELIARLQHFNTSARNEALNNLKDVITNHQEVLINSLGQLVKGVTPLVLDRERSVRRESFKVLHVMLSPLTLDRVAPFFDILCSYLRCAMTHIDTAIHEDSLQFFDILLLCVPDLVAYNIHKILPSFLDMISKMRLDSKPGRTLKLNLGSKMTSVKWRSKVLSRLNLLLETLNNIKTKQKEIDKNNALNINQSRKINNFSTNKQQYYPIYRNIKPVKLSLFSRDKSNLSGVDNEAVMLQSYVETLTPLLFETWLEVKPSNATNHKTVESVLSEESASLLKSILHIINHLWNLSCITESEEKNVDLTTWFLKLYQDSFSIHIADSFPYIQGKMEKKKGDKINLIENEKVADIKCVEENLLICFIYITIHSNTSVHILQSKSYKVLEYIMDVSSSISNKSLSCQQMFIKVLQVLFKSNSWVKLPLMMELLECIINLFNNEKCDANTKQSIFSLLTSILLSDHLSAMHKSKIFQSWLTDLPKVICNSNNISLESFNIIYRMAIQDNKLFNDSIKGKIKEFLERIPCMKIIGITDNNETKMKLISLLYWIKQWDTESLNLLQDQLGSQCYDNYVKEYLIDILKIRTEGAFS